MGDDEGALDAFSREVIRKLMQKDEFQELWTKLATSKSQNSDGKRIMEGGSKPEEVKNELLLAQDGIRNLSINPICHFHPRKLDPTSHQTLLSLSVSDGFQQLSRAICVALHIFAHGTQMARYTMGNQSETARHQNRDAVALYSTHVRLERFCTSHCFHRAQFALIVRQIGQLFRSFAQYVSSVYSVERCSFLADNLLHLLVKFYEGTKALLLPHDLPVNLANCLAKSITKFDGLVCGTLRKMMALKSVEEAKRRRSLVNNSVPSARMLLPDNLLRRSNSLPRMEAVIVNERIARLPYHGVRRQRSFLLSPELDYDRQRLTNIHRRTYANKTNRPNPKNGKDNEDLRMAKTLLSRIGPMEISALKNLCKRTLEYIEEVSDGKFFSVRKP